MLNESILDCFGLKTNKAIANMFDTKDFLSNKNNSRWNAYCKLRDYIETNDIGQLSFNGNMDDVIDLVLKTIQRNL